VVSIVGPSGAGKTTLLQIIGTLDKPDSGDITIDGIDVSQLSTKKLSDFRNQHLGFVFQFHQLLPEFTALENIMIPAFISGQSRSEAKSRAEELLDFMNLSERANHKPAELSGGEKQRVAVARALVNHPAVILADEPSGSLDTKNKAELHQLFFDLRDKFGQTFVIVTHDEELAKTTDRTIHLKDGLIIGETTKDGDQEHNYDEINEI
jgi:lipoprotein-releasing system ATP-binding protein